MGKIADAIRDGVAMPEAKRRQMLALDEQFSKMEAQIQTLQTENMRLQAQVKPLERDVERLKQQVQRERANQNSGTTLEKDELDLIKLLAMDGGWLTSSQIAMALKLHPARVEHFLHVLLEKQYILGSYAIGEPAQYQLDHKGNEYLVKNGLV